MFCLYSPNFNQRQNEGTTGLGTMEGDGLRILSAFLPGAYCCAPNEDMIKIQVLAVRD